MSKIKPEDFIAALKEMSIKEVLSLVEAIKEEFGIDPTAVAVAAPAGAGEAEDSAKKEVSVKLVSAGQKKIEVIKAIKEITNLGLMESKKLVDSAPIFVKEAIKPDEADRIRDALVAAGAEVSIE